MKSLMEKLEHLLELGGIKKDITLLVISGIGVLLSLLGVQLFPFGVGSHCSVRYPYHSGGRHRLGDRL